MKGTKDIVYVWKKKRTMETFRFSKLVLPGGDTDITTVLERELGIYTQLRTLDRRLSKGRRAKSRRITHIALLSPSAPNCTGSPAWCPDCRRLPFC